MVGILVFVATLFLLAFYLPNTAEIRRMKGELRQDRDAFRRDQQTAQALQGLAAEVGELREVIVHLDKQLPAQRQLDQFLRDLTVRMEAESLDLLGIKPEPVQKGQQLDEMPIQIGFCGSFAGTHRFLRRLESMQRITRVDHLQLVTAATARPERLSGTMRLCIFVLRRSKEDANGSVASGGPPRRVAGTGRVAAAGL